MHRGLRVGCGKRAMEPLPIGAVMPRGWLKFQLDRMAEGLVGRLCETSEFLTRSDCQTTRRDLRRHSASV